MFWGFSNMSEAFPQKSESFSYQYKKVEVSILSESVKNASKKTNGGISVGEIPSYHFCPDAGLGFPPRPSGVLQA